MRILVNLKAFKKDFRNEPLVSWRVILRFLMKIKMNQLFIDSNAF
jgi:hypothetical protein